MKAKLVVFLAALPLGCAFPNYLPCNRIIKIGQPVMVNFFKGGSTAAAIQLDKVDCGGTLITNTNYSPKISGIPWNPLAEGESVNECIQADGSPPVPNLMYLIDVTDANYNPFPGANFVEGVFLSSDYVSPLDPPQYVQDGKVPLYSPCPSRSMGALKMIQENPYFAFTNSTIRFSDPGVATIRLAFSHGPQYGVYVVENCTYTIVVP